MSLAPVQSVATQFLSRLLGKRALGFQRDLRVLLDGLAGRHPPPLIELPPRRLLRRLDSVVATLKPRTLQVTEVIRETADAVTLLLASPSGEPIQFEAGQFLTLLVPIAGRNGVTGPPLRRAYSACSSPLDARTIAITSKRVAGGQVSNYLNDAAAPGMLLGALGPSGNFTPKLHPSRARHLLLIGGGSGITPLMSIVQTLLQVERGSRVTLLYGNRRQSDIIFYDKLRELCEAEPERLTVRHVLSEPPEGWSGGRGLLDEEVLTRELEALPTRSEPSAAYYLCGPAPMMAAARAVLLRRGVPVEAIAEERFASLREESELASPLPQPLMLQLGGQARAEVTVRPGETLLEAGLAAGAPMPFSCALGGCGACKGRLLAGEVSQQEPNCLTAEERAGGYILCCVARPRGAVEVEIAASGSSS